jgi:hypothetical protein
MDKMTTSKDTTAAGASANDHHNKQVINSFYLMM